MTDGFRYFISRPTGENGDPIAVESTKPAYFRAADNGLRITGAVEFWDGATWQRSIVQPFTAYIDDAFSSGATLRELLDESEIPHA